MTDAEKVTLNDHANRISNLELSTIDMKRQIEQVSEHVLVSQVKADVQSGHMIQQNESLIKQNERFSQQLTNIFDRVMLTKENESGRAHETNRLTSENKLKLVTVVIGSGGIGFLVLQGLINIVS